MDNVLYREGHEDLANAIVIMAANDYREACKKYKNGDDDAYDDIREIERFFNSRWGNLLCHGKAKKILWRLQQEQREKPPKKTVKITKREI
jgi:hypothetical protein